MDSSRDFSEKRMPVNLGAELSRLCAQIASFGEVLDAIRQQRRLSQDALAKTLARSPADISRLINNKLPKSLTFTEVHWMASNLNCSRTEVVELINALICHVHYSVGTIDLDEF